MNILIISFHTCPVNKLGEKDTGGLNLYVHQLSEQLGEKNHNVDIYTRKHDKSDPIEIDINQNSKLIHIDAGDLNQNKNEMVELLHRKGKFDLNKSIFDQIQKKEFDNNKFDEMAVDGVK